MQTTTLLRPPEPSCLPSAPAITNFFPPHLIPIHLFLFPRPPSLISTPLRLPSVVSLPPPLSSFSLSSSSRRFVSSVSRLSTSLSTPISLASSYLSLSLSGVEEAEYHLEKMAFFADMPMLSHTHTHTRKHTQVSPAIHCLPVRRRCLVGSC